MLLKIPTIVKYNYATFFSIATVLAMLLAFVGCQPKTNSYISGQQMTEQELRSEYEAFISNEKFTADQQIKKYEQQISSIKIEAENTVEKLGWKIDNNTDQYNMSLESIKEKQRRIDAIFNVASDMVMVVAPQGYAGILATLSGILALGLGIDNRRKDGVIKGQKMAIDKG